MIQRTAPAQYNAMQLTSTNQTDMENFISSWNGENTYFYDENNVLNVYVNDDFGHMIPALVEVGDWVTKIFVNNFTVIKDADFTSSWEVA